MNHRSWFPLLRERSTGSTLLFCLPCAGAGAALYRGWQTAAPTGMQVVPVELPGRGSRFSEQAVSEMGLLVSRLVPALTGIAGDHPIALFGHSMGAWIAFEAARLLGARVRRLFVSAAAAPHVPQRKRRFDLNDAELKRELNLLGGTPDEVLANEELMQLLLPMLRADFALVGAYRSSPGEKAPCPITVFAGRSDPYVDLEEARAWEPYATARGEGATLDGNPEAFRMVVIEGGHFFVGPAAGRLLEEIACDLSPATGTP